VWIAEKEYLQGLRKLCHEHGLLLALDEVQTGMGRTGKLFAYEHYGIEPDLMTLAKGLGAGFPIGAMLAKEEFAQAFTPGSHGSTFGGNPLACAAGVATLETLLEDGFILDHCREMGEYLLQQLRALQPRHRIIKDIRGKGLLVGMELTLEGQPIVQACLDERCLINCTAGRVLRFMPPLTVTREEIDQMIGVLDKALSLFDVPASP
jgi:acetylornithine/succinyldiaminopimelate/putrescine aminotransferase